MTKNTPKQFLIEGVDRLGKSTLINGLLNELGYRLVVHYDKPKLLDFYGSTSDVMAAEDKKKAALRLHQFDLYLHMFRMIAAGHEIIFDRAHLGELVYAPIYRGYDPSFVLNFEQRYDTKDARLVLLTTSDFSFIKDDGLSLDFSKKEEEQDAFIRAWRKSSIKDKILIDVSNGKGGYRPAEDILDQVLRRKNKVYGRM